MGMLTQIDSIANAELHPDLASGEHMPQDFPSLVLVVKGAVHEREARELGKSAQLRQRQSSGQQDVVLEIQIEKLAQPSHGGG